MLTSLIGCVTLLTHSEDVCVGCFLRRSHQRRRSHRRRHPLSHSLWNSSLSLFPHKPPQLLFPSLIHNFGILLLLFSLSSLYSFMLFYCFFFLYLLISDFVVAQWYWFSNGYVQVRSSSLHFRGVPIRAMAEIETIAASKAASSSSAPGAFHSHYLFSLCLQLFYLGVLFVFFFTPQRVTKRIFFYLMGICGFKWSGLNSCLCDSNLKGWLYFSLNVVLVCY